MSQINVDAIRASNGTGDAISFTASDKTCTANITNNLSNRNLIINGAMNVAQRATSTTSGNYGFHVIDRFRTGTDGQDESLTIAQADVASGTTPYTSGFRKALKITNGNQTSGAGAGDYVQIDYTTEAQDIATSGWNYVSSSSKITLSFWVKASVAQSYTYAIRSLDGTAQVFNCKTPALTADTWTKITKVIPGDSNLTFDNNNGGGFMIMWFPFVGTTYTTSGLAEDTWSAWASAKHGIENTTTWWTTNDATFELTGVQLEVGDYATDFEHRSYGDELLRCCRYYYRITHDGTGSMGWAGPVSAYGSDTNVATIPLPVPMRIKIAALETSGTAGDYSIFEAGVTTLSSVPTLRGSGIIEPKVGAVDCPASVTAGRAGQLRISNSAYLGFSAEL